MGGGDGRGAEGRLYHTFEQKNSHYVFTEVHKQPQITYQAEWPIQLLTAV